MGVEGPRDQETIGSGVPGSAAIPTDPSPEGRPGRAATMPAGAMRTDGGDTAAGRTNGRDNEFEGDGAPPAEATAVLALPTIAGYEILGELGRGGMGIVYHARQLGLDRPCALKMILAGAHADAVASLRFLGEAEAVAKLQHPNVVQIYHVGQADGLPFFELEYVDGGSLDRTLDGVPWPPRKAAALLEALARGVAEAHRLGVVHRDLKPSNILLAAGGTPKIADFGLAKRLNVESGLTATDTILGSPSYMAPEQAEGRSREVGPLADVYALGAILYELMTGRPPFLGATLLETLDQVKNAEPVPPSRLVPGTARDLETIALMCLRKEPARRYASAAALAEDLARYRSGEVILARRAGAIERAWRWSRRHRAVAGLLAALAAALAVGFAGMAILWARAEGQADLARTSAAKARNLATTAAQARDAAQVQEKVARDRAEDLAWQDYINRVNRAFREILDDNIELAEGLLHGCPPERRGWEWHYVKRLAHLDRLMLDGGSRSIEAIAYSPDGAWVATAAGRPVYGGIEFAPCIRVWDVTSGALRHTLRGMKGGVFGLAVGPNGSRIAACGGARGSFEGGSEVAVWDAATGERLWIQAESDGGASKPGLSVAFTPDGRWLVVGCGTWVNEKDGYVLVRDAATGRELFRLPGPGGGVAKVAVHPDGKRLAVAGSEVIELWDLGSRRKLSGFRGHTRWVFAVAFSPDGKRMASAGWDHTVRIWDVETAAPERILFGHEGFIHGLAFSPDGALLASASEDGGTRLWQVATGRPATTLHGHEGNVHSVAFRPDGREVATGSDDGTARLWDLRTCRPIIFDRHRGWVVSLAVRRDGRRVFSEAGPSRTQDDTSRVWDPSTGEEDPKRAGVPLAALGPDFTPGVGWGTFSATSPDGRLVALVTGPKRHEETRFGGSMVAVRERASGRLRFTLAGHTSNIFCLMFSPDGRRVATSSDDRTIKLWNTATGHEVFTLRGHGGGVPSLAFTPDGHRIVSGGEDGHVRVWDGTPLPDDVLQAHDARHRRKLEAIGEMARATDDVQRAEVLATGGQLERAIDVLDRAVELKPDDLPMLLKRADLLAAAGRWKRAIDAFGELVARRPDNVEVRHYLHLALLQSGDIAGYQRAASEMLARRFQASANNVAWFCVLGPLPDAIRDAPVRLVEPVATDGSARDRTNAINTLGAALYRAGRFREAIRWLDESVHINNVPEDWVFLAMTHHRLGNREEARRWLDKLGSVPRPGSDRLWAAIEIEVLRREAEQLILGRR
jgi:WD40 repeat protein